MTPKLRKGAIYGWKLATLARRLIERGMRVGIITNDQTDNLVDTVIVKQMLSKLGVPVEEVVEGCFCCKFDELINQMEKILARQSGRAVVSLVAKDIRPSAIMNRQAFLNAIAVDMAIGGSTNTLLHLLAVAQEARVEVSLDDFDRISRRTPNLCRISPSGAHHIVDFHEAGGRVYPLIMEARPDLKVIVCSGYSIHGPAQDILDAGAEGFIQKPFLIAPFAEKLKEVLEGK